MSVQLAQITNPALQGTTGTDQAGAESGSLLFSIIEGALTFFLVLATIILLINLVRAGFGWMSSGSDSGKLQEARSSIINGIVGIILLAAAFAVWTLVKNFLGIEVTFSNLLP